MHYVVPKMELIPQDKTMSGWYASVMMLIHWHRWVIPEIRNTLENWNCGYSTRLCPQRSMVNGATSSHGMYRTAISGRDSSVDVKTVFLHLPRGR